MKPPKPTPRGVARIVVGAYVAYAGVAAIGSFFLGGEAQDTVLVSALAIAGHLLLHFLVARRLPGRPISIVRWVILLAASQPALLIAATFIERDVTYVAGGVQTHHDSAWLVALAGLVLHVAMALAASTVGRKAKAPVDNLPGIAGSLSRLFLGLSCGLALAHLAVRLVLLVGGTGLPAGLAYSLRLYVAYYLGVWLLAGLALRRGLPLARLTLWLAVPAYGAILLSGSRGDSLVPLLLAGLGYLAGRPTDNRRLVAWTVAAAIGVNAAMFVGEVVRGDQRGRTAEALAARLDDLQEGRMMGSQERTVSSSTIRRFMSNSAHAVVTRIPKEIPHEHDGVWRIPGDVAKYFLPRLLFEGTSDTVRPRNWMLNDLGFLVNWSTAVELNLVADAWFRGGFLGLLVVGLIVGLALQVIEDFAFFGMKRWPELGVVPLFMVSGILTITGRDVVTVLRAQVFHVTAALTVAALARWLARRRQSRRVMASGAAASPGQP